jgi:hypothetical protein
MARREPNLWNRMVGKLRLEPEVPNFEPEDFFMVALLPVEEWPIGLADAHWVWVGSAIKTKGVSEKSHTRGKNVTAYPVIRMSGEVLSARKVFMAMNCIKFEATSAPTPTCGHVLCMNPNHMMWTTRHNAEKQAVLGEVLELDPARELAEEIERLMTLHKVKTKGQIMALPQMVDYTEAELDAALAILGINHE